MTSGEDIGSKEEREREEREEREREKEQRSSEQSVRSDDVIMTVNLSEEERDDVCTLTHILPICFFFV